MHTNRPPRRQLSPHFNFSLAALLRPPAGHRRRPLLPPGVDLVHVQRLVQVHARQSAVEVPDHDVRAAQGVQVHSGHGESLLSTWPRDARALLLELDREHVRRQPFPLDVVVDVHDSPAQEVRERVHPHAARPLGSGEVELEVRRGVIEVNECHQQPCARGGVRVALLCSGELAVRVHVGETGEGEATAVGLCFQMKLMRGYEGVVCVCFCRQPFSLCQYTS